MQAVSIQFQVELVLLPYVQLRRALRLPAKLSQTSSWEDLHKSFQDCGGGDQHSVPPVSQARRRKNSVAMAGAVAKPSKVAL
jgi:hypothetical protein